MWIGVISGFAGEKFSVSPKRNGAIKHKVKSIQIMIMAPIKSL
jgi:hypothetical protein